MSIPKLPGVPQLATYAAQYIGLGLTALGILDYFDAAPSWGIFDENNTKVIEPDSVVDMGMRGQSRVSDFPVEKGSFASYNKVQEADSFVVRMSKGGRVFEREAFLTTLDAMKRGMSLYSVVTPEKTYTNAVIESYNYRRELSGGAGLIIADIEIREIRQVVAQYTKSQAQAPQQPAAATSKQQGKAQPTAASTQVKYRSSSKSSKTGSW